jgi:CheY-like chemotaxis protein
VQRVLVHLLEKNQCSVVCARDGEEAWQLIEKSAQPYDVVLTDLSMPRLTGMQLMERISNSCIKIPVVLMTAYAATLNPKQVRDAGFAAVLSKPMVLEEVVSTLGRVTMRTPNAGPAD